MEFKKEEIYEVTTTLHDAIIEIMNELCECGHTRLQHYEGCCGNPLTEDGYQIIQRFNCDCEEFDLSMASDMLRTRKVDKKS